MKNISSYFYSQIWSIWSC